MFTISSFYATIFLWVNVATVIKHLNGSDFREDEFPYVRFYQKCRLKFRRVGSRIRQDMDFVTARKGGTLELQCHFCYENDSGMSKTWYFVPRGEDPRRKTPTEVEFVINDQSRNRFSMKSDHSLVITNVNSSDTGYYFCHGVNSEEAEYKYNYMLDVIEEEFKAVIGDDVDWDKYSSVYYQLNERLAIMNAGTLKMHAIPEWSPWSQCDGCQSARVRVAECKLSQWLSRHREGCQKLGCGCLQTTTPFPEQQVKVIAGLEEYDISCQSIHLKETAPHIYNFSKSLMPFIQKEWCSAPCSQHFGKWLSNQPKFRNFITIQEGEHITMVCPESTLDSVVIWRKDGIQIGKRTPETRMNDHILVDTFSNLYITYARSEESGNYTCYVNGARIQEVVVLVQLEAAWRHAAFVKHIQYLVFMLMFGVIFYIAGLAVAWTQRQTFQKVDFKNQLSGRSNPRP